MTLHYVVITDTHLGPTSDYQLKGVETLPRAARLVEAIEALPLDPAFVVHLGDVATDEPTAAHYRVAGPVFDALTSPVHFVPGNHDASDLMAAALPMAPATPLGDRPIGGRHRQSFSFTCGDHGFVALDARDPEGDEHARGIVDPGQLDRLEALIQESDWRSWTLFLHFPPIRLDSPWLDDDMILRGGEVLHDRLLAVGPPRVVFFGHVHRSIQHLRDGVYYVACPSSCVQFPAAPIEEKVTFEPEPAVTFQLVTYDADRTWIKQYRVGTETRS